METKENPPKIGINVNKFINIMGENKILWQRIISMLC